MTLVDRLTTIPLSLQRIVRFIHSWIYFSSIFGAKRGAYWHNFGFILQTDISGAPPHGVWEGRTGDTGHLQRGGECLATDYFTWPSFWLYIAVATGLSQDLDNKSHLSSLII